MGLTDIIPFPELSLSTWVLSVAAFLLVYNYVRKASWKNMPPGPPVLPIIGSLPFMDRDIHRGMTKFKRKYGEMVTVYVGTQRMVFLNGLKSIKEAFIKQGHIFSGRPDLFWMKENLHKSGIISAEGDLWKEQRRYVLHVLRNLGLGKPVLENKIHDENGFFLEALADFSGVPYNPRTLVQKMITNITSSFAFGRRLDYDDPQFEMDMVMLDKTLSAIGPGSMLSFVPELRYIPGDLFGYKSLMTAYRYFDKQVNDWIDEKMKDDGTEEATDLIAAYIQTLKKESKNPDTFFSKYQLLRVVNDLLAAGSDTTGATLNWAIAYMALHPDVQNKVHKEIDEIVGNASLPRMEHRSSMPYIEACINETQRLGDVAGFGLPHAPTEDTVCMGYFIPKGTIVVANTHSVHSDPELWSEPGKFKPDRFISEEGRFVKNDDLMPFSVGKRVCLGEGLARMELFLIFSAIMQRFTIKPGEGAHRPQYKGVVGFTNQPKPYKVIFEKRLT